MTRSRSFIFLATCILVFTIVSCQSRNKKPAKKTGSAITEFQLLRRTFHDSVPQPAGYVTDYEKIFSAEEKETLDGLASAFEEKTTIEIAVITFDSTMITVDSLDALTLQIADFWGVGQKNENNGVVIGLSRGLRRIRIQYGIGIEKILTEDETVKLINATFIPAFHKDRYFEGVQSGLKALMILLEERYKHIR